MPIDWGKVNTAITDALGLDSDGVVSVDIHIEAGALPTVKVFSMLREPLGVTECLQEFELVPKIERDPDAN